jgi:hypothetical protein
MLWCRIAKISTYIFMDRSLAMQMSVQRFCRATRAFSSDGGAALPVFPFAPDKGRLRSLARLLVFGLTVTCLLLPAVAGAADSLPVGFIASAPDKMTWSDAKAYCASKGGKLPLVGGSNSLLRDAIKKGTSIDGFGAVGAPGPSGLPNDEYWTGTEGADRPGRACTASGGFGNTRLSSADQGSTRRVVCVP